MLGFGKRIYFQGFPDFRDPVISIFRTKILIGIGVKP